MEAVRLLGIVAMIAAVLLVWKTHVHFSAPYVHPSPLHSIPTVTSWFTFYYSTVKAVRTGLWVTGSLVGFVLFLTGAGFLIVPEPEWKRLFLPKPRAMDQAADPERTAESSSLAPTHDEARISSEEPLPEI